MGNRTVTDAELTTLRTWALVHVSVGNRQARQVLWLLRELQRLRLRDQLRLLERADTDAALSAVEQKLMEQKEIAHALAERLAAQDKLMSC